MNNDDNIAICTELQIDMDLKPLLGKEGVTLEKIRYYHHWRRGYGKTDIGRFFKVCEEEIEPSINHIQKLLSPESLATDIELRNEILDIKHRSEEKQRQLDESLSKSANYYLERGINPAKALQQYRNAISDDFSEIENLRAKDGGTNVDEKAEDHTLEDDLRHISSLRNENKKQAKRTGQSSKETTRNSNADSGQCKDNGKRRKQRRLSIRIEDATLEKLQQHIENSGLNISKIIRHAIDRYLDGSQSQG